MFKVLDVLLHGSVFVVSDRSTVDLGGDIDEFPAHVLGQLLLSCFEAGVEGLKLLHGFAVHATIY
jgi:hypothetical protein